MQAQHAQPFIRSLGNTFRTMLQCPVRLEQLWPKSARAPLHDVTGVIGLSGRATGMVVVSFSEQLALCATAALLLAEPVEIDDDVIDAVGELTNMVAGGAKAELPQWDMSLSTPSVIVGSGHTVRFPSSIDPLCISFDTDWGPLALEMGLAVPKPAEARAAKREPSQPETCSESVA
jgi:chemotaxis protein CheX